MTVSFAGTAFADSTYCHSTYCSPTDWIWNSRTPEQPYGRDVKLGAQGEWIDRNGHRVWAKQGTRRATVISANNSDERNGELAYKTAYDSFIFGRNNGLLQVERLPRGGRWEKKITTGDGIVLYKDAASNVAVQAPDGKWHITNRQGDYASTSLELEMKLPERAMVAKKLPVNGKKHVAKAKKSGKSNSLAKAKAKKPEEGRKIASVEAAPPEAAAPLAPSADEGTKTALESLASLAGKEKAEPVAPAAPAAAVAAAAGPDPIAAMMQPEPPVKVPGK